MYNPLNETGEGNPCKPRGRRRYARSGPKARPPARSAKASGRSLVARSGGGWQVRGVDAMMRSQGGLDMKKKLAQLDLHRETLRALDPTSLPRLAGGETGSNPHTACLTCTLGCPTPPA